MNKRRSLPKVQQKEIRGLLKIYRQIDKDIAAFKKRTALSCLPACGECCRTACVYVSVLEMQPVAAHLWETGEMDYWLDKIDRKDERAACVFYSAEVLENGGHCRIYPFRPLLCRLFGFSGRENKRQKVELMLCGRMKAARPEQVARVEALPEKKVRVPLSMNYLMKTYAVSPQLANEGLNINLAFAKAAERIGLYGELSA